MLEFILLFIYGCTLLYYSSDFLIEKSILISKKLNISPIIIGATIVAIGTSLPELLVSLYSIFSPSVGDPSSIVIGNILGSNIANIALVIGVCVLFYKLIFESDILKDLLFISLLGLYTLICLFYQIHITYLHGIILLLLFVGYIYYLITNNKIDKFEQENVSINWLRSLAIIILSIIGLALGTHLVVENAIGMANFLNIDELAISITIVALGTSLPELFSCIIAIKNKHYNLLLGNIIGSNVINIVFVLGFSSLFKDNGLFISTDAIKDSLPIIATVFILSHAILIVNYLTKKSISTLGGVILLMLYIYFSYNNLS